MIVGYTTGVFDMFHIGHLNIIRSARKQCDYLIVGVSTDKLVNDQKNVELITPYVERADLVASIRYVDEVIPQDSFDKMVAWKQKKFDKMFVGNDWKGSDRWNKLESDFQAIGVYIEYLPYTKNISSTHLRKFIEDNYAKYDHT